MERDRAVTLVTNAIEEHLCRVVSDFNSTFNELGADSLDEVRIIQLIANRLDKEIDGVELNKLKTVNDMITLLEQRF